MAKKKVKKKKNGGRERITYIYSKELKDRGERELRKKVGHRRRCGRWLKLMLLFFSFLFSPFFFYIMIKSI